MKSYRADVWVESKNNIVETIGKTTITHPEIKWDGKGIKWFDDSQLLRKKITA